MSLSDSFENILVFLSTDNEYITTPAIVKNIEKICINVKSEEHKVEQYVRTDEDDDEQISIVGRILNLLNGSENAKPVVSDNMLPTTSSIDITATPKKSRMRKFDSKIEGELRTFGESRNITMTKRGIIEKSCFQ